MPQLNAIVVTDNVAAPHTFSPVEINGGVALLVESTGVPVADRRLTLKTDRTQNGRRKVTVKMQIPVVQDVTVNGISRPTVVRTAYAESTLSFDETSSTAERDQMFWMFLNAMGNEDLTKKLVVNLQALF